MKIALTLCVAFLLGAPHFDVDAAPGTTPTAPFVVRGTVATNRLGQAPSAFLRSIPTLQGSVGGTEQVLTPDIAAAVAKILLDDRTWVGRPGIYDAQTPSLPFHPTVQFTLTRDLTTPQLREMQINIDPVSQQLNTEAMGFPMSYGFEQFTSYAVNAPQVTALLKKAFPQNTQIQALSSSPPPEAKTDPAIPQDVRARIAALRPGMTRADLLKLFRTEGGLYSRFQRTYLYRRDRITVPIHTETLADGTVMHQSRNIGEFIKINAEFLPHGAHLKWIDGAGVLIDPNELSRFSGSSEKPDDVIVRLSKPYVGMEDID